MRALTLWQIWAELIVLSVKTIETRSWSTDYRGPLLIHAAAKRPPPSHRHVGEYRVRGFGSTGYALEGPGLPRFRSTPRLEGYLIPFGAVVGIADLVDVVPIVDDGGARNCVDVRVGHPEAGASLRIDEPQPTNASGVPIPVRSSKRAESISDVVDQLPYGDFTPGRYAWLLDNVRSIPPINARGRQRLWHPSEELVHQVAREVAV